ncbi:MAG: hypothetical protein J6W14_03965, partial [Clostridia bacterium]|nr:hypothetical protein [Clostridia bacterium]
MKKTVFLALILATLVISLASCSLLSSFSHLHRYGAWSVEKEATCTEAGVKVRACKCGEKETEAIPMIAHTPSDWIVDKAPTYTAEGEHHKECTMCHTVLERESIPTLVAATYTVSYSGGGQD